MRVLKLRRGLGFDLEPLSLLRVDGRCKREHLERDVPSQRYLLGLVYHPHTTATHLPKDAVIAQLSTRGNLVGRFAHRKRIWSPKLRGRRLDEFQTRETLVQSRRDFRMARQKLIPRPRTPGTQGLEIPLQGRNHPRVVTRETTHRCRYCLHRARAGPRDPERAFPFLTLRVCPVNRLRCLRSIGLGPIARSGIPAHRRSSSVRRNRDKARSHTFFTLSSVRSMRRATSGKLKPSSCRKMITSR